MVVVEGFSPLTSQRLVIGKGNMVEAFG